MNNRPAVKVLIPYLAGIMLADKFDLNPLYLWIPSAVFVIFVFAAYKRRWLSISSATLVALILSIGFLRYEISMIPPDGLQETLYQQVLVRGTVLSSEKERSGGSSLIVKGKATSINDPSRAMSGKISIRSWEEMFPQRYGDVVELEGLLSQPRLPRNPGIFNYRRYLAQRGIFATMNVDDISSVQNVGAGGNWFLRWTHRLRERMEIVIDSTMPQESASVLKGIVLGDREELSDYDYEAFLRTGTSHIFAVSGLHVGILALWVFLLFKWLRRLGIYAATRCVPRFSNWIESTADAERQIIAQILVVPVVVIYACVVGLRPSVVRASILVVLFVIATIVDRDRDLFNLLAIAALVILVYRPGALWDVGFQLSFGVVASILYLVPRWEVWFDRIRSEKWYRRIFYRITYTIGVSWSAQIGAVLIIAYNFNRVPASGFAANPVAVPIVGLIVPFGIILCLTGMVSLPLASFFGHGGHSLIYTLKWFISHLSDRSAYTYMSWFSFWHLVACAAIIVFTANFFGLLKERRRLAIAGASVVAVIIWSMALSYDGHILKVTYLDVGQGDSIFVDLPNGKNILIDGGPYSSDFDTGKRVVAPFLQGEGVGKLDLVVSTHPHNDHAGGLTYLVENEDNISFRVGEVITGNYGLTTPTFQELGRRLDRKGIGYRDAQVGAISRDREVQVEVLGPARPDLSGSEDSRMNNNSVVLRVTYGGVSFLFAGDIGEESERSLINSGKDIKATVLKVPHQGSKASSSWEFLQAVQPAIGIISVGRWNSYGHPSPLIMGRYRWLGINTYRTDRQGAITVITDGRRVWVRSMLESET